MGHLERNPIKNIPHKLWLFFPLLGLITELLLVSRCPILLQWSSVSVSHQITFINCSRTLRHTEKSHRLETSGFQSSQSCQGLGLWVCTLPLQAKFNMLLHFHPIIWSPLRWFILWSKHAELFYDSISILLQGNESTEQNQERNGLYILYMRITCSRPSTSPLNCPPYILLSPSGRKRLRQLGGSDGCFIILSCPTACWHVFSLFVCFSCLSGRHCSGWRGLAVI